jgi:glycosyltransferase involved in cell wall biosynthesis
MKMREMSTSNIYYHGFVENKLISSFLKSFDVVLLPNQTTVFGADGKEDIGKYTSPMKLFEYMANKKIILASNISVIREVVDNSLVTFLSPTDSKEWVNELLSIEKDWEKYFKKAQKAYAVFNENYTWDNRAQRINRLLR